LRSSEKEDLDRAKRYALDQSVKYVMLKQRDAHQQQVTVQNGDFPIAFLCRVFTTLDGGSHLYRIIFPCEKQNQINHFSLPLLSPFQNMAHRHTTDIRVPSLQNGLREW
jgi:hypothetical protein